MKKLLWLIPVALVAWLAWMIQAKRNEPPTVAFAKATRERLVSTLVTNGKVEPLEWAAIRAEREGVLAALRVEKGQTVARGQVIGQVDVADARADLAAAESRIAQARADVEVLRAGGRARDIAELASSIDRQKSELAAAQREAESLRRLVEKKAATQYELTQAEERAARARTEIAALEKRRDASVSKPDVESAEARVREAESAAAAARRRIEQGAVKAPVAGTVYQLDVRQGAFVRPGDSLGQVGVLDHVRVRVYVDEPELGGVRIGQKVTMTWDAMPGRKWDGVVEKLPTEITALGTRQVGEVLCNIDNPERVLIPGTNVTAELLLNTVENALVVPKEVLRRENTESGVYVLVGDKVAWRRVRLGAASVTKIQVVDGLKDGDLVALPTEQGLKDGMVVAVAK